MANRKANGKWQTCDSYQGSLDGSLFSPSGEIRVVQGEDSRVLSHQAKLGQVLNRCKPTITETAIDPKATRDELYARCAELVEGSLNVPVRMVSFGPTELDKLCR